MEWQWGKRSGPSPSYNARFYKQDFCPHHIIHSQWSGAWAALLLCYLPVRWTIHRFWLETGSTRNEVCELSYGQQKGYYWQIEKACLLSSLFLPAFIFNTSLCTETGLLETNRQFGDRGTRPHLIILSLLDTSGTGVAGRTTYCWKVFGLVFVAVGTPRCSPTFGAECVYFEHESIANWVAVAGPDSSSAAARRHRLPTAMNCVQVPLTCRQAERWIEERLKCKW
jgi:hypothetical protein